MTIVISDNNPRISYTATAGQTAFPTNFAFFDEADINVYINDTLQTLTTNYTVTGGSGSDGTVTLVTGATAGDVIVLTRDVELERTTDFPSSGPFQVGSLNTELDKIIAMIADMEDLAERGLRLSDSDTSASLVLADKDSRKGTVLAFNSTTGAVEVGPTIADTQSIADIKADIAALADIEDGTVATDAISDLAAIASDVTTVAGVTSNVTTVAGQTTNMQNVTDNLSAIQNAATNATTASTKATEAATSATNAATSATAASTAQTAAETAKTGAETAKTAAETAQTAAETAKTGAETAQTAAETAETNAATSETNAATSATTATTKASEASTSATNAATSETNASNSETSAASSATAAQTAKDAALAALDSFDDRYLGVKSSAPTVDNDGNALVAGAIYFDSTAGAMQVYTGSAWVAAYVSGSDFAALVGATFTGSVTMPTVDINGGAIDGTTIGGSTAAAGTFTTLTGSGDVAIDTDTLFVDVSADKVGIGTSSPVRNLDINSSDANSRARFTNTSTGTGSGTDGFEVGIESQNAIIWNRENGNLRFATNNAERMNITSGGNVGLGETSPTKKLVLSENDSECVMIIKSSDTGNAGIYLGDQSDEIRGGLIFDNSTDTLQLRASDNQTAITIDSSERVGIGTSSISSDADRLHVDSSGTNSVLIEGTGDKKLFSYHDSNGVGWATGAGSGYTNLIYLNDTDNSIRQFTNGTERMRIDSNGNVGIGNSNPENASGYKMLTVGSSTSTTGVINAYDGTTKASVWVTDSGIARFGSRTNHPITLEVNGSEKVKIQTNGQVTINGGGIDSNGGTIDHDGPIIIRNNGVTGQGDGNTHFNYQDNNTNYIRGSLTYFNSPTFFASGAKFGTNADANNLDDYEEGTWTPSCVTGTLSYNDAFYVKIGQMVFVSAFINNFSTRTGSNTLQINGLPFGTNVSSNQVSQGNMSAYNTAGTGTISSYIGRNRTYALFYAQQDGGNYVLVTHGHLNNSNANFYFTATYRAV